MERRDINQLQAIDAEMAERASMRKGLASIPMDYEAMMPDESVGMANGGIVAFGPGGDVEEKAGEEQARGYLQERANLEAQLAGEQDVPATVAAAPAPVKEDPKSISSFVKQYSDLMAAIPKGASYKEQEEAYKNSAAKAEATKKQDLNFALIQLGLAAAAGKSPRFLQNIADAGVKTLPAMQEAYKQRRLTEEAALKGRAELDRMSRAEQIEALKGGIGLYGKERDIAAAAELEKLKDARALAVAKAQKDSAKPTDLTSFVNDYVAERKQAGDKRPTESLRVEGYQKYPGYVVRQEATAATAASARGAQNVTKEGQALTATSLGIKEFNDLSERDPAKKAYKAAAKQDKANAEKGVTSDLAGKVRQDWIKANTPGANPGGGGGGGGGSVLPPGSTTGKVVPGKGTEVLVNGKVVGYAN